MFTQQLDIRAIYTSYEQHRPRPQSIRATKIPSPSKSKYSVSSENRPVRLFKNKGFFECAEALLTEMENAFRSDPNALGPQTIHLSMDTLETEGDVA